MSPESTVSSSDSHLLRELIFKVDDLKKSFHDMDQLKKDMENKFEDIASLISRMSMMTVNSDFHPRVKHAESPDRSNIRSNVNDAEQTFTPVPRNPTPLEKKLMPLKPKFERLPALVKGYLSRRLMRTEKVQKLKEVIYDLAVQLVEFDVEGMTEVSEADIIYHETLMTNLDQEVNRFHSIFCVMPPSKQMEMIRLDRQRILDQDLLKRQLSKFSAIKSKIHLPGNSSEVTRPVPRPRITSATLKRRERLQSTQGKQRCVSANDVRHQLKRKKLN
jgi:predicted transcriptional regulator